MLLARAILGYIAQPANGGGAPGVLRQPSDKLMQAVTKQKAASAA
jgi:hypothetical protein